MPQHDFKQLTDYNSGYIILQNTVENDSSVYQMAGGATSTSSAGFMRQHSMSPMTPDGHSTTSGVTMTSGKRKRSSNYSSAAAAAAQKMAAAKSPSSMDMSCSPRSPLLMNGGSAATGATNSSPSPEAPMDASSTATTPFESQNHYKKIHFLPTRRGAQLKLFHNVNFFRTDKHFQMAIQFMKEVDVRYIAFQWQYQTENGWETFKTSTGGAQKSSSESSNVASSPSASSSSAANQNQKPFVLIHKLNVEQDWLKMEVQFPIGSVALKGKQVKWKTLNGGKMFRIVMTTFVAVEGSPLYEKQTLRIPYVIDNKRSKENEKIEKIHAHFELVKQPTGDVATGVDGDAGAQYQLELDEKHSCHAEKIEYDTQATRISLKELEFLHIVFPPHLLMSNHVLTEVMSRSSRESSPMSSVSSPGSNYSSMPSMMGSVNGGGGNSMMSGNNDQHVDTQKNHHNNSTGFMTAANNNNNASQFNNNMTFPFQPLNFGNNNNGNNAMQRPRTRASTASSNSNSATTPGGSNHDNAMMASFMNDPNAFMQPYLQSMQNQIQRMFQEQQMQQQIQHQRQMQQQYQQQMRQQHNLQDNSHNTQQKDTTMQEANHPLNEEMDLSFIDEFEHHHFNKLNQSISFQNIPQLSDVQEMPQKKRRRTNSNDFFGQNSGGFDANFGDEGDRVDKVILDFAPLNTHSSVSLLGSFRDLTFGSDNLHVYFGNKPGTILNVTSSCISVLTPVYDQPSEVSVCLQKNFQSIPKDLAFKFVENFNAAASQLANKKDSSSSNSISKSMQKDEFNASSFYDAGKPAYDEMTSFAHPQNHWANPINPLGQTMLHVFALKGLPDYVLTSLRIGIPPTKKDNMERTPLHLAAVKGHIMSAKLLLKCAGLNLLTWRDSFDETPLDLALRFQQYDFIEFLFKWIHVSFLPSKVHSIRQRFWYIFEACTQARARVPSTATQMSSNGGASILATALARKYTARYSTQINEQNKLIEALRSRLSGLRLENERLKTNLSTNGKGQSHTSSIAGSPRAQKKQQSVPSRSYQQIKSLVTDENTTSDSNDADVSSTVARLQSKTLQQQADQNAQLLDQQLALTKQLKQQLILSQLKNRQFELEYAQLAKEHSETSSQLQILKRRSRKSSIFNMVSHGEGPNPFEEQTQSPADRLLRVNENAWKQFLACQPDHPAVEKAKHLQSSKVSSSSTDQQKLLLEQPHFTASDYPIYHKLLAFHRNKQQPLKDEHMKSLKQLASQCENVEKIKGIIFGAHAKKQQERQSVAYVALSPFLDHSQLSRNLLSDQSSGGTVASNSDDLCRLRTALLINNCLLQWNEDSLVSLRRIPEREKKRFTLTGLPSMRVNASNQDAIVQQIVTWNRTKEYDLHSNNCQHFVDAIMTFLTGEKKNITSDWCSNVEHGSFICRYLADVRRDASLAIPHTYLQAGSPENDIRINFYSQSDIDEYMRECCQDMKPDEILLLQSFDSLFHFLEDDLTSRFSAMSLSSEISSEKKAKRQQTVLSPQQLEPDSKKGGAVRSGAHLCPLQYYEQVHKKSPFIKSLKTRTQPNRMRSNSIVYKAESRKNQSSLVSNDAGKTTASSV